MSVIVTKVDTDIITMVADIGFSDDASKWTSRTTLKIIPYTDITGRDVLIGITGSASQLSVMRAFLRSCHEENRAIEGDDDGIFKMVMEFNKFASGLGLPTGVEVDGSFSTLHIVADSRAWGTQGLFTWEITDWDVIGSGEPFARAAMTLGNTPVDSVCVACKHDLYCYGPPVSFIYDRKMNKLREQGDTKERFHDETFRRMV